LSRRGFLKGTILASLGAVTAAVLPRIQAQARGGVTPANQASLSGTTYMGTPIGRILMSTDGGINWKPAINFGPHCAVERLFVREGQLYARVDVQGYDASYATRHSFFARSADGRTWRPVDRLPSPPIA
jgi:hypothetical protein